jgi:hypothetical protein
VAGLDRRGRFGRCVGGHEAIVLRPLRAAT